MFESNQLPVFQTISAVCTTPWKDSKAATARARVAADFFQISFVKRKDRSVAQVLKDENCSAVVVMNQAPAIYHENAVETPLFFHPNMASQRILRMQRGESDRLIEYAGIREGDTAIDATLGLGADSIVLASAVGKSGKVISIESVDILYHLFRYALVYGHPKYREINKFLSRIELVLTNHEYFLLQQDSNSVDVVYFDPMFRMPRTNSAAFDPIRSFADASAISETAFYHAKRVARKCVIIKERSHAEVFEQFHLGIDKQSGSISYGIWRKE